MPSPAPVALSLLALPSGVGLAMLVSAVRAVALSNKNYVGTTAAKASYRDM